MDELILRALQGRITSEEAEFLRAWRARSAESEDRYRRIEAVWKLTAVAKSPAGRMAPSAESIRARSAVASAPRRGRRFRAPFAAAAVVLMVAAAAAVYFIDSNAHTPTGALTVTTGATEWSSAQLADGTVVRLGPSSRLSATAGASLRDIHLEGTAFFAVAHDASRPFIVRGATGTVRVLGTRFRMKTTPAGVQVTVVEGRVALETSSGTFIVTAGKTAWAESTAGAAIMRDAEPSEGFVALDRFFAFQETSLSNAAAELELRFGTPIRFADPQLGEITVSAWFNDAAYEEVITVLCRIADVRCSTSDGVTWIDR